MSLKQRIVSLLVHRGYRLSPTIRRSLDQFLGVLGPADADDDDPIEEADGDELAVNRSIHCPHCGEPIAIAIDLSGDNQDDVQDCTVCCRPIHVTYVVAHGRLRSFSTEPA